MNCSKWMGWGAITYIVTVFSSLCGDAALGQAQTVSGTPAKLDYARDIRPILSHHCWSCHGLDEQSRKAGLRLDTYAAATAELETGGQAINPEELAASELIARITSTDENELMPPPAFKKPMSAAQIELLKRWVLDGAPYSGHWAFTPPTRPALPTVQDRHWPREAIDYFVLQGLEAQGWKPNPQASRETLLRRVTYDLTGLPPTLQELQEFLNDDRPEAYSRVVDRLLMSPRHAERMALQWLDAARYADTNGYNNDEERTMWPWRNWVIRAFAENMPYDQFLTEQLAGDLLPEPRHEQRIATGFNRNHVLTTEGGIIEEEYRVEYVADRVHTTSTVFLGLSFQCARCHDHKFDPISQKDYYRFFAFFNNVSDKVVGYNAGGVAEPLIPAPTGDQQRKLAEFSDQQSQLEQRLAQRTAAASDLALAWEQTLTAEQKTPAPTAGLVLAAKLNESAGNKAELQSYLNSDGTLGQAPVTVPATISGTAHWKAGRLGGGLELDGQSFVDCGQALGLQINEPMSFGAWIFPTSPAPSTVVSKMDEALSSRGFDLIIEGGKPAVHLIHQWPENGLKVITKQAITLNAWHHVLVTWNGKPQAAGLRIYVDGVVQELDVENDRLKDSIETTQPLRIGRRSASCGFQGVVDEVQFYKVELPPDDVARLMHGQALAQLADVFAASPPQRNAEQQQRLRDYFLAYVDEDAKQIRAEQSALATRRKELEQSIPKMMVMAELPQPRETHVLFRGQYDQPRDTVSAGVSDTLGKLPDNAPLNRLGLAQWLTAPDHPLTARVAVNRWWAGLFGVGLVETVEDFGTQGSYPSHPELLDYLATELIRQNWDTRAIIRQIVMSATYQQSSDASSEQLAADPGNRWLGRGARYRLPAETLRDGALYAAGLLSEQIGGPSVKPYQPPGLWEEVSVERRYSYVVDPGDGRYRRSMYTFWKRTCPPPGMTTFDAPDRETCLVRRARTNTPLQALILLNDPTYLDAARQLARQAMQHTDPNADKRLALLSRIVLARKLQPEEQELLLQLHAEAVARYTQQPTAADQLLLSESTAIPADWKRAEWAAWTTVASVLLNLDEAVSQH